MSFCLSSSLSILRGVAFGTQAIGSGLFITYSPAAVKVDTLAAVSRHRFEIWLRSLPDNKNRPGPVVLVIFTLNRSFYPTSVVRPVSVLILNHREIQIVWSQTVIQRKNKIIAN